LKGRLNVNYLFYDINPRRWISKFRQNSVGSLLAMFGFYHSIGLMVALIGTLLIQTANPSYVEPHFPRYLHSVLLAGPVEESLFFGIPLYGFASATAALIGGLVWTFLHLVNTATFNISNLAYANWLFVFPSFFFSFRVWISGKGWFAVISHSAWNCSFFLAGCSAGEYECIPYDNPSSLASNTLLASLLVIMTYWLYQRRAHLIRN
jgi:hypothetical protein